MKTNTEINLTQTQKRTFKPLAISVLAASLVSLAALPAAAGQYDRYQNASYNNQNASYDYARVTNVSPRVETYQVSKPVEQCWNEKVPVRSRYNNRHAYKSHNSKTPEIVGAIIGGLIGNQVGKRGGGKARDVATVAGAVLGGSIGHDSKHKSRRHSGHYDDRYQSAQYRTVQRCEIKDSYTTEEHVVGYDVEYKYRGNIYHTQMSERPGQKIKVRVTVDPA